MQGDSNHIYPNYVLQNDKLLIDHIAPLDKIENAVPANTDWRLPCKQEAMTCNSFEVSAVLVAWLYMSLL